MHLLSQLINIMELENLGFLQRLKDQLGLEHPTAFIDAWADDTADDPFGALVSGVIEALASRLPKDNKTDRAIETLKRHGGKVLLRTSWSLGTEITKGVVGKLAEKAIGKDGKKGVKAVIDTLSEELESVGEVSHSQFLERREAVQDFRDQISVLLNRMVENATGQSGYKLPLFIIIDELDRCRPSYAIKLLEEVKHLFANPGLVFIFGMNSNQLEKSVRATYGSDFNGRSYLKRFISREYRLRDLSKHAFCQHLLVSSGVDLAKFRFPPHLNKSSSEQRSSETVATFMASYYWCFEIELREIKQQFGYIETFCDLWPHETDIDLFLLMSIILNQFRNGTLSYPDSEKLQPRYPVLEDFGYRYYVQSANNGKNESHKVTINALMDAYAELWHLDLHGFKQLESSPKSDRDFVTGSISSEIQHRFGRYGPDESAESRMGEYLTLLQAVSRIEAVTNDDGDKES